MSDPTSKADLFDYTPLTEPVMSGDFQALKHADAGRPATPGFAGMNGRTVPTVTITLAIVIGVLSIAIFSGVFISLVGRGNWITSLVCLGIIGIVGAMIFFAIHSRRKMLAKLYKFATRNNLQFLHDVPSPGYAGMIFDEGNERTLQESLRFPSGIEMGNYQYVTGSGKSRQVHQWGFLRIKLVRRLPNMVLDARSNNIFGMISNLPASFSKGQKLQLEGDFDKHFTLYAPEQYKRDALYVFTPDVMAAAIDSGKQYDMEVIDDNLMMYVSRRFELTSPEEIKSLLMTADKIGDEIRSQSDYYMDERVANRAENIVAEPGRRLKTNFGWWFVVIIIFIILFNLIQAFGHH